MNSRDRCSRAYGRIRRGRDAGRRVRSVQGGPQILNVYCLYHSNARRDRRICPCEARYTESAAEGVDPGSELNDVRRLDRRNRCSKRVIREGKHPGLIRRRAVKDTGSPSIQRSYSCRSRRAPYRHTCWSQD
jgi:hypothetical protein